MEWAGACYHVINRGNYRRNLFAENGAAESFQVCLFEATERFGWRLHAFVVMRNHFHLAVETPEPNLSDGMQWLQATWAARFNRLRREVGRPFQGRFKALHVEPGHALAQVAHYIHLNPVRAKVVNVGRLTDFAWSSLTLFAAGKAPQGLISETVLAESGGLRDTGAGWRKYVEYLGVLSEEETKLRNARFGRLSRGWAIGSPDFKNDLRQQMVEQAEGEERFRVLGADGAAHREVRALVWEDALADLAKRFEVSLEALPAQKSAEPKLLLAAAMKATTSVSNGWLAERLQMGQPASVSQFVRRFRLGGGADTRAFRGVIAAVKK